MNDSKACGQRMPRFEPLSLLLQRLRTLVLGNALLSAF